MRIDNYSTSIMSANMDAQAEAAAKAKAAKEDAKMKEACKGFEAMFLNMMYKQMRSTVQKGGMFGDSNAEQIMQDMLDTELVNRMADSGGVGLADMLYKQLKQDFKNQQDAELRAKQAMEERASRMG